MSARPASVVPADVVVEQTLAFLEPRIPGPPARILDVGCGRGDLAAGLLRRGFEVTALDRSADAVREARAAGVPAVQADFVRFHDAPYDVVLFSRSLHHIHPLRGAVARAAELLKPDGRLVAEEFAREAADRATAVWFYDACAVLEAAGVLERGVGADPPPTDSLEQWREDHRGDATHPLHDGAAMLAEIRREFDTAGCETAAYLYAYLSRRLERTPRGYDVALRLFQIETRRIADGLIVPLGLRIVGQRREASRG